MRCCGKTKLTRATNEKHITSDRCRMKLLWSRILHLAPLSNQELLLMIQICLSRAMMPEMRATRWLLVYNISRDMVDTIGGVAMEMKQGENREQYQV